MEIKKQKDIYKSFGNINRVKLIICLAKEKSVTDLLTLCELSQSALSQHLKILKDSDIISCERQGKMQMYKVTNKKVLEVAKLLLTLDK